MQRTIETIEISIFHGMNKFVLILVWVVAFVGNASATFVTELETDVSKNPHYHTHNGFFFSFGLTYAYSYVRYSYSDAESSENQYFKGALIPYAEARFGWYSAKMMSTYLMIGVGYGTGDFEYDNENYNKKERSESALVDINDFRFLSGIGTDFYLVRDKESLLYGVFLGVSLGYVFDKVYTEDFGDKEYNSFFVRFEAGKDWWLSDYWSVGVALNYTLGSFPDDFSSSRDEHRSYGCHTFGITVRVAY